MNFILSLKTPQKSLLNRIFEQKFKFKYSKIMNRRDEEVEPLANILTGVSSENKIEETPSQSATSEEWQLQIIPIKTQNSGNIDTICDNFDPTDNKRVIHSSEAPEEAHKFVQNYVSLNLDQVMESKIGPSGFYLKYLITVASICCLMMFQILSIVTFAFRAPTYICTNGPESTYTFECTEDQYC